MPVRLAIVGTREEPNGWQREVIFTALRALGPNDVVVTGDATGIDTCALHMAQLLGVRVEVHEANWKELGKLAGPERNGRMVLDSDRMLALPAPRSRGTWNAVKQMTDAGKPCFTVQGEPVFGHYVDPLARIGEWIRDPRATSAVHQGSRTRARHRSLPHMDEGRTT